MEVVHSSVYRVSIENYDSKFQDLKLRLIDILEIEVIMESCSFNLQQQNITICYGSKLLSEQYNILANLVSIIFNGSQSGVVYPMSR